MTKIPLLAYLKSKGFECERIIGRYVQILKMLHSFLRKQGLGKDFVVVNGINLIKAIVDYFIDVIRIKEFNPIKTTNKEKVVAYMAYWLLKRKPLQAVKDFEGCDSINEYFVTDYVTSIINNEKKIGNSMKNNPSYSKFYSMLFYNLKYRLVTQQSIELMIDAFYCGCDFPKQ
jgi:hypothetical protein